MVPNYAIIFLHESLRITKVVYASSSSCVHNIDFEHAPQGRTYNLALTQILRHFSNRKKAIKTTKTYIKLNHSENMKKKEKKKN